MLNISISHKPDKTYMGWAPCIKLITMYLKYMLRRTLAYWPTDSDSSFQRLFLNCVNISSHDFLKKQNKTKIPTKS